jgi:hypothetical protein
MTDPWDVDLFHPEVDDIGMCRHCHVEVRFDGKDWVSKDGASDCNTVTGYHRHSPRPVV